MNRKIWLLILTLLLSISCASNRTNLSSTDTASADALIPIPKEKILSEELRALLEPDKASDYRFGPEDIIEISVRDEEDLTKDVIVGPDGKISFPMIGTMRAAGKTIDELKKDIESKLVRFILKPQVGVIVKAFNSKGFHVLGKVNKPGFYKLKTRVDVLRAISEAGGVTSPTAATDGTQTVDTADLTGAFLARGKQILPVDFEKLLIDGDLSQNIPIKENDFIYIPSSLEKKVLVLGEVGAPGSIRFGAHITLMEAISEAGGHLPATAVLDDEKLIRGPLRDPSIYSVNVKSILAAKTRDVQLQRYDIVYVPPTRLASASRIISLILPFLNAFSVPASYGLNERFNFKKGGL